MTVRRWAAIGTMLVVVGAGTAPADAGAATRSADQQWIGAFALASVLGPCGGESVALTGTQDHGSNALPVDGVVRTRTIDLTGWDQHTSFTATGRVRTSATRSAWGTRRLVLNASLAASTTPTAERRCGAALATETRGLAEFTIGKRSWLVAESTASGSIDGVLSASRDGASVVDIALGQRVTRLVAAGHYRVRSNGSTRVEEQPTGSGAAASGTFASSVALIPVGTRRSLTGNGTGYLTVGHRDCSLNRVRASFTAAGRSKVRRATFSVNGSRRLVLRGSQLPRSGAYLGSIARTSKGTIRADLVLRSGARRTTYATSWPCA